MTVVTDAVLALKALLAALPDMPAVRRNDTRLEEFDGQGRLLAIADDDILQGAAEMGDPPVFELQPLVTIIWAVAGEPTDATNAIFDAGVDALAGALFPNKSVGEATISINGAPERLHMTGEDGATPVEVLKFTVALDVTAPTPLG